MDWEIQKRSEGCIQCEKHYQESEVIFCLLEFENEIVRKDFCEKCWEENLHQINNQSHWISYWKTHFHFPPKNENQQSFEKNAIENLLRQWIVETDPKKKKLCYLLAVMLERKKILEEKKVEKNQENEKELVVFEKIKTGETFVIEKPPLNLSEISFLQEELSELLDIESLGLTKSR